MHKKIVQDRQTGSVSCLAHRDDASAPGMHAVQACGIKMEQEPNNRALLMHILHVAKVFVPRFSAPPPTDMQAVPWSAALDSSTW